MKISSQPANNFGYCIAEKMKRKLRTAEYVNAPELLRPLPVQ